MGKVRKEKCKEKTTVVQDPEISSSSSTSLPVVVKEPAPNQDQDFSSLFSNLELFNQNYRSKLGNRYNRSDDKWFSNQFNDLISDGDEEISADLIKKFEDYAEELLRREVEMNDNQKHHSKSSEAAWLQNVTVGGTVGDRIAALVVQIHENPFLNLAKIRTLIAKIDKANRRESLMTAEALRDLCAQSLMPDRKLVTFDKRPLLQIRTLSSGNKSIIDKRLIMWLFEDRLKKVYEDFTRQLEKIAHDTVETNRIKASSILIDLLINKPEQEQFLLSSVVNKLGDPSAKVATKVVHFLRKLLDAHPIMKPVVVKEVQSLIYRLHVSPRAQYYALNFLTQVELKRIVDADLASVLISIYFTLFKLIVEKGVIENKMLALLLRGTNKAFPVANDKNNSTILKDIDTLYKVVAIGTLNTSLQAMLLLLQVLEAGEGVNDRFYCSLYRRLLDPGLESSHHNHALLFHLLYKMLKTDTVDDRVAAFLKRLLQIALNAEPSFSCAVLMLVSEVMKEKGALLKCAKKAQNFIPLDNNGDENDDEEEHYIDVHGAESEYEKSDEDDDKSSSAKIKPNSWLHRNNLPSSAKTNKQFVYDHQHRNPIFSNAQSTLLYELEILSRHYHPSVALFAQQVMNREAVEYSGDPLQDFTLMRFLDRFAYRNPKNLEKSTKTNEDDEEQPEKVKKLPKKTSYHPWGAKQLAVTSEEYAKAPTDSVPVDEQFLHKYIRSFGVSKSKIDDDAASVNSDEFEAVMKKKRRKKLKK